MTRTRLHPRRPLRTEPATAAEVGVGDIVILVGVEGAQPEKVVEIERLDSGTGSTVILHFARGGRHPLSSDARVGGVLGPEPLSREETESSRGRGRPEIGPATNIRLGEELTARLDAARGENETRAAAIRRILTEALRDEAGVHEIRIGTEILNENNGWFVVRWIVLCPVRRRPTMCLWVRGTNVLYEGDIYAGDEGGPDGSFTDKALDGPASPPDRFTPAAEIPSGASIDEIRRLALRTLLYIP
jgi:hypothetical protein